METAARQGIPTRCLWLDTPLAQAQVNLVQRLLERFDGLPSPEELKARARSEPGLLTPTQQMRAFRELEPPSDDEGFASVEHTCSSASRRVDARRCSSRRPQRISFPPPASLRARRASSSTGTPKSTPTL